MKDAPFHVSEGDWESSITKSDYEALAEFRYELRKFLHFSEEAAQSHGLTPQQHQAMLAIKGFPGRDWVSIRELAERLQIKHHSAVGLIDRLVENEWICRQPSVEDRRCVIVTLTPRGTELLERLSIAHKNELIQMSPVLRQLLKALK
ncbi:MAG: MarR family winged helix-turn-helix transcriptional regulator [Candidatus Methylacidiphilales bacterium]|nr:MarR family transcriptional regulator [Candidatus Methylacidiphilales bacterium]